jgi:hypothetical protein
VRVGDLRRVQQAGFRRLQRLRRLAERSWVASLSPEDREILVSHCVIEAFNFWVGYTRSFFVWSALRARDGTGGRVALAVPTPGSVDEALTYAIRRNKPWVINRQNRRPPWSWRDEPDWSRPDVLLDALDELGASNHATVTAALSVPTPTWDHLKQFRNFYAHRGSSTALLLRPIVVTYSLRPSTSPTTALLTQASGSAGLRPQPVLLDWLVDIENAVLATV